MIPPPPPLPVVGAAVPSVTDGSGFAALIQSIAMDADAVPAAVPAAIPAAQLAAGWKPTARPAPSPANGSDLHVPVARLATASLPAVPATPVPVHTLPPSVTVSE